MACAIPEKGPDVNADGFFHELPRRHVVRVAVVYAVAAWVLLQLASIVFPTFRAPDWALKIFIEENNAYFAGGMQDDIPTTLASIRELKVISRTSTSQYASSSAMRRTTSPTSTRTAATPTGPSPGSRTRSSTTIPASTRPVPSRCSSPCAPIRAGAG
jgi:hypothetical protein